MVVISSFGNSPSVGGSTVFSIHLPAGEPWYSDKRRVVDAARDLALQFTGGIGSEGVRAFALLHGQYSLPFSVIEKTGRAAGKHYFTYEFVLFSDHFYGPGDSPTPMRRFSSEEASHWRRIAAEALLIFGRDYNGFELDPGYARVQLGGEILTRRDFGYTE